ncbi:MAG: DedA family protein [Planctomycetes bacterium]|nr:DedA family protein [Planctomycetota bacterium]
MSGAPSVLSTDTTHTKPPVPKWAIHRRLYDWTLSFADHRHSTWWLAILNFTESIFFPIPSIALQIPMTLARRDKAWWYALVSGVSSVLGGMVGYGIGYHFADRVSQWVSPKVMDLAREASSSLGLLVGGAIAIHPYKIFTLAAGILKADWMEFMIASIVGRFLLFFAVAAMLWAFGPPMKRIIEKYFNIATVILGVVVIAGVLVLKVFRKPDSAGPPPADVASVATPSETSGAAPTPPSRP